MGSPGFLGRVAELRTLVAAYEGSGSGLIPIYGRRRVGKSELILQFLKGAPRPLLRGQEGAGSAPDPGVLQAGGSGAGRASPGHVPGRELGAALDAVVSRWRGETASWSWLSTSSSGRSRPARSCPRCSRRGGTGSGALGQGLPDPLRLLRRLHGAGDPGQEEPALRPADGPDPAAPLRLSGGGPLPPPLLANGSGPSLFPLRRRATLPALLLRRPLHRDEPRRAEFLRSTRPSTGRGISSSARSCGRWRATTRSCWPSPRAHDLQAIAQADRIGEARGLHYYLQQLLELGYLRRRYPLTGGTARGAARALRARRSAAPLLVPLRLPEHQLHPAHGTRAGVQGPDPSAPGRLLRTLLRAALPGSPPRAVPAGRGTRAFEVESTGRRRRRSTSSVREDGWTDLGECKWGAGALPARGRARAGGEGARLSEPRRGHDRAADLHPAGAAGRPGGGAGCDGTDWRSSIAEVH